MAQPHLTDSELLLAEWYVSVLDYVSRCAQAIDEGNWHYLQDKAGQLQRAAQRLAEVATEAYEAEGADRPRRDAVRAAVALHGRHYRAGRLLHPQGGGR